MISINYSLITFAIYIETNYVKTINRRDVIF